MALSGWTLCVLLLIPYRRFKAAFAGRVTANDFRCGESSQVPADVSVPNRAFMNLLELPVLFYVLCVVAYVTHNSSGSVVQLAWAYVGFRVLHSLIYLTYNRVLHRFLAFTASNAVLITLWAMLLIALAGQP